MKRNSKRSVTSVTALNLPVLFGASDESHDGFGIVRSSGPDPERRGLKPLSLVSQQHVLTLLNHTPKGKAPRSLSEEEWSILQAAHSLRNALERKDELELEHAFELLQVNYPVGARSRGGAARDLWEVIALDRLDGILSSAHLIYWFDSDNQLRPGIYCPDRKTAMIVSALLGDSFRICPKCRTVFVGTRTYCKLACQGAHRVARYRARKTKKGKRA